MDTIVSVAIIGSVLAGVIAIAPSVKMGLSMAPYLYANTRCASRTGLILKKKDYEQLINASSIEEFYALLEDTYYGRIIERESHISKLLDEDLFENYTWLTDIVPTKIKPIVDAIKLKFTVQDLKYAMNECDNNRTPKNLRHIDDESLRIRIESSKDIDGFLASLKETDFEINESNPDKAIISNALDIAYYKKVHEEIQMLKDNDGAQIFEDYWKKMIDIVNLRLTMRRINGKGNFTLLSGGHIKTKDLLSATDSLQLENVLSKSIYKEFMIDDNMENALYRGLRKEGHKANAKQSLKAGTIVKYMIEKELEIRNLKILSKLKLEKFDNIEKYLVL